MTSGIHHNPGTPPHPTGGAPGTHAADHKKHPDYKNYYHAMGAQSPEHPAAPSATSAFASATDLAAFSSMMNDISNMFPWMRGVKAEGLNAHNIIVGLLLARLNTSELSLQDQNAVSQVLSEGNRQALANSIAETNKAAEQQAAAAAAAQQANHKSGILNDIIGAVTIVAAVALSCLTLQPELAIMAVAVVTATFFVAGAVAGSRNGDGFDLGSALQYAGYASDAIGIGEVVLAAGSFLAKTAMPFIARKIAQQLGGRETTEAVQAVLQEMAAEAKIGEAALAAEKGAAKGAAKGATEGAAEGVAGAAKEAEIETTKEIAKLEKKLLTIYLENAASIGKVIVDLMSKGGRGMKAMLGRDSLSAAETNNIEEGLSLLAHDGTTGGAEVAAQVANRVAFNRLVNAAYMVELAITAGTVGAKVYEADLQYNATMLAIQAQQTMNTAGTYTILGDNLESTEKAVENMINILETGHDQAYQMTQQLIAGLAQVNASIWNI